MNDGTAELCRYVSQKTYSFPLTFTSWIDGRYIVAGKLSAAGFAQRLSKVAFRVVKVEISVI